MARPKNPRNALLHAIEQASHPLYLLDASHQLVFLNQACADWLGGERLSLVGLPCQPSALPLEDPQLNRLRGLVPHPSPLSLVPTAAELTAPSLGEIFALRPDGSTDPRMAQFILLSSGEASSAAEPSRLLLVSVLPSQTAPAQPGAIPPSELANELRKLVTDFATEQPRLSELPGLVGRHPLTWRFRKQLQAAMESKASVLLLGTDKMLAESFARSLASDASAQTLPTTTLNGRLSDEEQWREALGQLGRRLSSSKTLQANLLLLRADLTSTPSQLLLREWLQTQGSRVRTITTSEVSLFELAAAGQYDFELAVTLSTQEITIPRLDQRLGDLPAIAAHWLEHHQSSRSGPAITLGQAAIGQLLEFEWTGDLEQLRSILLQAAMRLPEGGTLQPQHLPDVIRFGIQARRIGRPTPTTIRLDEYLQEIERLLLERALLQANQNKSQAARLLGLTRQRFLRRCEQLQVALPEEPIDFRLAMDELPESESASDQPEGES